MDSKKCSKCKLVLPIANFTKCSRSKDGLRPVCRQCHRAYMDKQVLKRGGKIRKHRDPNLISKGLKLCTKCEQYQDKDCFSNKSSWCKKCKRDLEANARLLKGMNPRQKTRTQNDELLHEKDLRLCLKCNEIQSILNFSRSKRGYKELAAWCRNCNNESNRKRQDQQTKYVRNWRKDNVVYKAKHRLNQAKRRFILDNVDTGSIDKKFLECLYETEICAYCNKVTDPNNRTLDHIVPLSKGGLHDISNAVMACHSCNSRKRDLNVEKFMEILHKNV